MFLKPVIRSIGGEPWRDSFGDVPDICGAFDEWESWLERRIAQFDTKCPSKRATTYYFSQDGDDTNGNGSFMYPWKTMAKATSVIAASSGDVRCRFRRGDVWREGTGISIAKNNITLDDYGWGDKPVFDAFTVQHTSGWSLAAGNRYTKTEANDVAWVKINDDPLGEVRGTHLIRVASSAACESTSNSFYWDSGGTTLHLNLAGDDPNNYTVDICVSNQESGVEITGDGCRVENLIGYGWGCDRTTNVTQEQPFTNRATGTKANFYTGLEGYYSGSHCMAHHHVSAAGGKSLWLRCRAGFAKYSGSGGVTIFNSYSASGGQETWFIECEARYGQLKSSDWSYTNASEGTGFYAHTGASYNIDLIVIDRCHMNGSHTPINKISGIGDVPTFDKTDPTTCRAFTTRCKMVPITPSGTGGDTQMPLHRGIIYNNDFEFRPAGGTPSALTSVDPTPTLFAQNKFTLDMDIIGNTTYGLYNTTVTGGGIGPYFYHNWFHLYNCEGTTGASGRWGLDYDVANNTTAPPSGTSQAAIYVNNIMSCQMTSGNTLRYGLGLNNIASNIRNNAFFGVDATNTGRGGYSNDAGAVTLLSAPTWNTLDTGLQNAGDDDLNGLGLRLSHDFNGNARRTTGAPDIGPVEF